MGISKTEVLREFPAISRYRVRLLTREKKGPTLDLREYIASESFEGFTRRGIVLSSHGEVTHLRDILNEVLASGVFAEKSAASQK